MDSERVTSNARRLTLVLAFALALAGGGCATVDVKGRETLRVGPLRGVAVAPTAVAPEAVTIDAGTDALTDDELTAIAAALPGELSRALADRVAAGPAAPRALGVAHIRGCRLRAGPGRANTVYEARCQVAVLIGDVPIIEVHTEALRRVRSRAISEDEAKAIRQQVRNPLLSAEDGRLAIVAALEAAAALIIDGRLPRSPDAPPVTELPREQRAALARERLARDGNGGGATARAALFDLSASGVPKDAEAVLPYLTHEEVAVRVAAVDALGELCAPWSAERLEPLTAESAEAPELQAAAGRALVRVRACATFAR